MRLRASARAAPGTRNRTTTVEHDAFGLEPALGTQTLADRSSVFFYGTLTDPDVLQRVLARRTEGELEPAWVDSFRRVQAMVASYPLLLPASGTSVPGLLLRHPSRSDIVRINHFENGEYRAERHTVRLEDGSSCEAWLYMGLPDFVAGVEPWHLAAWQAQHKAAFLAECDAWMADCPEPD